MRKLRMGMVGGGKGAFIGAIHRVAAQLNNDIELVCGAFSRDPQNSIESGQALFLEKSRCYPDYKTMFAQELLLSEDKRMDFVAIVTPNHLHFDVAKLALESGFHVICDKPATFDLAQAHKLKKVVEATGLIYGLTHTYSGYPMVKEAKQRISQNELGHIRKIVVEYSQGWLGNEEDESSKQASWRLDPAQAGISCCMGDIGVHAAHLAEYISGLSITKLCAVLTSHVKSRALDDDGTVLLEFDQGAQGVLIASQISVGEENALSIRIYGEQASIHWQQQEPNTLIKKYHNKPSEVLRVGVGDSSETAQNFIRTPAGHPEGYIEAFANIYQQFSAQVRHVIFGDNLPISAQDMPSINAAVRGMAFIEQVVKASESSQKWMTFNTNSTKGS